MKNKLTISFVLTVLFLLTANMVSAQKPPYYKWVKLVDGHKTVFQGRVYEDYGYNYQFNAKAGQTLTVKLIGRNVTFTVNAYDMEPNEFTPEGTSWSGKLIRNHTGQYAIALKMQSESLIYPHSSNYRLEVTLK